MVAAEMTGVGVIGVGKHIPAKMISNEQIESWTGIKTSDIIEKTGIKSRYIVEDNETASGISAIAANQAIKNAGILPEEIDLIIACTFSGDYIYPAMACKVQNLIGAKNSGAFDVMANCTGFQVGLSLAANQLRADNSLKYILVLGTAIQSRFINWNDPDIAFYFGDGSGAAILGRVPENYGLLSTEIFSNTSAFESVRLRGGGSSFPLRADNINEGYQYYEMNGIDVWKQVIQFQPVAIRKSLEKIQKKVDEADFFIFHQANLRLIEYLMAKMRQPMNKTYTNVETLGNTADASLAITLCEAVEKRYIKRDDLVVISGVGAGFTFGSSVLRWY